MFSLPQSRETWNTDAFDSALKKELCSLDTDMLPLQQGLRHSSYAVSDKLSITILNKNEDDDNFIIKVGLFYNGVIAGCNCADDPTPVDESNEYCDVLISINKQTAEATARLVN